MHSVGSAGKGHSVSTDMDGSTQVSSVPHVTFRKLGGEPGGVVLNLETAAYYRLNALGAMIWEELKHPITLDSLIETVAGQLDDRPKELEQDVTVFLQELAERDLVRLGPPENH